MKRVLLLKSRAASEPLSFLLEEEGVEALHLPLLEVTWPSDPRGLRAAAEHIGRFQWIVADSPQAVRALAEALAAAGSLGSLGAVHWLAPDEPTARAISHHGWVPRVVQSEDSCCGPGDHSHPHQHSQWGAVAHQLISDEDVLVVHELDREPAWVAQLREGRGAVASVGAWVREALPALEGPRPDLIVVDSPSAGEELLERHRALLQAPLVAVGPATARTLERLGAPRVILASSPSTEAVFDAALSALADP